MKTNFDICCENAETMAQIIDVMKCGWTKEQVLEWLKKPVTSQTLIKRYQCIKEIIFECCDDDGRIIENKYITIPIGSIWQESPYMVSGGRDNIHLDREDLKDRSEWCEPLRERLQENFIEIEPLIIY